MRGVSNLKKDTTEQKLDMYNQKIKKKEQQIEELEEGKRKLQNIIFELENNLHQGFRTLSELNQEQVKYNTKNYMLQQNQDEQERAIRQRLRDSSERFEGIYKKETQKLDDEREILYKKRSDISWD